MSYPYDRSGQLFNDIIERYNLKNDAGLCKKLGISAPVISKIRNGKNGVSAEMILLIHEKLRITVADIRALVAMPITLEAEAA